MGADSWSACPRCLDRAVKAYTEQAAKVASMYGKVPVEEFDAAREALVEPDGRAFVTFREDYTIEGADIGAVTVDYRGICRECSLHLSFKHTEEIPGADE